MRRDVYIIKKDNINQQLSRDQAIFEIHTISNVVLPKCGAYLQSLKQIEKLCCHNSKLNFCRHIVPNIKYWLLELLIGGRTNERWHIRIGVFSSIMEIRQQQFISTSTKYKVQVTKFEETSILINLMLLFHSYWSSGSHIRIFLSYFCLCDPSIDDKKVFL